MKKTQKLVALLISVFLLCQVSVIAAPYKNYPYVYEDFEDKTTGNFFANRDAKYQVSEEGYGNSEASLKVDISDDYQSVRLPIKMELGTTYKLSCYLKASENLDATSIGFFLYFEPKTISEDAAFDKGYVSLSKDKLKITKDSWIKLEATYTFDGQGSVGGGKMISVDGEKGEIELRYGDGKISNINRGMPFSYLMDDLCVEPVFKTSTVEDVEPNDMGGLIKDGSFEGTKPGKHWVADGVTATVTQGGANETTQCLKISGNGVFKQQIPLTYSHTYSFTGFVKGTNDSLGKTASLVIDRNGTLETYEIGQLTDDWQSFSIDYYKPALTGDLKDPYMYISVEDNADFYFDEISLSSEKGLIHNGDFSEELGDYWTPKDADTEILTDDVPDGEDAPSQSIHITQTVRNGNIFQNIYLKPETEYKLSFWAKGSSVLSGKEVRPTIEDSNGNTEILSLPSDNKLFSEEWTYYETTYKTSKTVNPLQKFYIVTNVTLQKRDFYLTDIKLVENTDDGEEQGEGQSQADKKYDTPEIRNPFLKGEITENKTVVVNAEYLGTDAQTGLIQLFKQADDEGWASIKTSEFNGEPLEYTFKASDVGQKIKFRIVPMDATGKVGGIREVEVEEAVKPELEINKEFTTGLDGIVSGFAEVINRTPYDKDVVCMIMLYDDENSCVGVNFNSSVIASYQSENLNVDVVNPGTAVKAKLFVWEGSDTIDTSMISLSNAIKLEKK